MKLVPLALRFEDFLLGAEPILFFLAGFATTAFKELVGTLSYPVL